MKYTFLLLFFALCTTTQGQSFDFQFDHQAIVVTDVDKSAEFYGGILKLKEIPHPERKDGFRWFLVHGNSQIHLIEKDSIVFNKDKSIHLCLATQNLEGFIAHLKENGVAYWDWPGNRDTITNRVDGVKQIYIQDPDGYWIEINTAEH
ncbi:VOC family protein [Flavobacteriaceae bacterium 3-367]|uniref:VOC family protein n=1 Tax=Eudoraea algarum TaxID=3417568 RepID=UPI003275ED25